MSRKTDLVLRQIFSHPIPMNIKWRDIIHLFKSLGAELEVVHGGREKIRLNGQEHTFHIPHGSVLDSKDEIVQIKHFLESAGITHHGH
ncbi:hypothetical protein MNBD_PLANCTO03-132 [hydrothermal vent metagenome]|uniref:HicA protein n=1 Tax=hydrothermal vent metagenome TaxID=652676 RepID=A0A3B1E212_9ZZZZ